MQHDFATPIMAQVCQSPGQRRECAVRDGKKDHRGVGEFPRLKPNRSAAADETHSLTR
jgi:hypothetical protein